MTGLVVHDTATYWSLFGHTVIFILIAGRVYRAMSLYRGKIPQFRQIIAMLR